MTSVPRLSHPYVTDNYGMAAEGHGGNKVELFISSAWQSPGVCPKLGFKFKKKNQTPDYNPSNQSQENFH